MNSFTGYLTRVQEIPTTTGICSVTFMVGDQHCKAFNDLAPMIDAYEGLEVEAGGLWRVLNYVPEFHVLSIKYHNAAGGVVTVVESLW